MSTDWCDRYERRPCSPDRTTVRRWFSDYLRVSAGHGAAPAGAIFPILKDGTVHKSFWPLLHAHDPDEFAGVSTEPRPRSSMSDSAAFDSWLDGEAQRWSSQTGMTVEEAKQTLRGPSNLDDGWGPWPPPDEIERQVRRWLSIRSDAAISFTNTYAADKAPDVGSHLGSRSAISECRGGRSARSSCWLGSWFLV